MNRNPKKPNGQFAENGYKADASIDWNGKQLLQQHWIASALDAIGECIVVICFVLCLAAMTAAWGPLPLLLVALSIGICGTCYQLGYFTEKPSNRIIR